MRRLNLPEHVYSLLDAIVAISSDLDLHSVLDRIIVAARNQREANDPDPGHGYTQRARHVWHSHGSSFDGRRYGYGGK